MVRLKFAQEQKNASNNPSIPRRFHGGDPDMFSGSFDFVAVLQKICVRV